MHYGVYEFIWLIIIFFIVMEKFIEFNKPIREYAGKPTTLSDSIFKQIHIIIILIQILQKKILRNYECHYKFLQIDNIR